MLLLEQKKHGLHFYKVWFAKGPIKKKGLVAYHESFFGGRKKDTPFDTLLTDFTETEDEIKQHFAKSCKYKINRAERENVTVIIKCNEEITDKEIQDFCDFFQTFWESKGTSFTGKEEIKRDLEEYRKSNALTLAYAIINGERAVYHTHIFDEERARLLHSASLYRLQDGEDGNKNVIGMANRYLHFEEIKYFKNAGKMIYDWGGAGKGEEVFSITEFKESFGGAPACFYDFEEENGLLAKLFKLLVKVIKS